MESVSEKNLPVRPKVVAGNGSAAAEANPSDNACAEAPPANKPAPQNKPGPAQNKPAPQNKPGPAQNKPAPQTKPGPAQNKPAPQTKPGPAGGKPQARSPQLPDPRSAAAAARKVRKNRARQLFLRLCVFVLVPTLLACVYFGILASDRFESVSMFAVHSADSRQSIGFESLIGAVPGSPVTRDSLAVRDYILSRDMLRKLDAEHQFIAHYQADTADLISKLPKDASFEDAYDYYLDQVSVDYDSTSGSLTLRVRAFSAEASQRFALTILAESEKMVNDLSERARLDQIEFAQKELATAEKRLLNARQSLVRLQQDRGELNPEQSATAAMTIRTQLETELAAARAELMQLRSYMQPNAPKVIAVQARVRSLSAQVAQESNKLVNPKGEKGLNASIAEFEGAALEKEFAQHQYESTLATLEIARTDASRQHRYLATIAKPSLADEATHPRRWLGVLTVFLLSFLLLGIGSLLVAAIKEHARI